MLSRHSNEVTITDGILTSYLDQVRVLIDKIASDLSLSARDRSRIVDLLGKVGDALPAGAGGCRGGGCHSPPEPLGAGQVEAVGEGPRCRPGHDLYGTREVVVIDHQDRQNQQDGRNSVNSKIRTGSAPISNQPTSRRRDESVCERRLAKAVLRGI